jgi:hypothetical protein
VRKLEKVWLNAWNLGATIVVGVKLLNMSLDSLLITINPNLKGTNERRSSSISI